MSTNEKTECLGCQDILARGAWIFSHVAQGGAVVCSRCGERHTHHPNPMLDAAKIYGAKRQES